MRSLLLILAVVVCSNLLATKVPKSVAELVKIRNAVQDLEAILGTNNYLKSTILPALKDKDIINRLAQHLIDQGMTSADYLVYSNGALKFFNMNMARDQHENEYQTPDNLNLLVDGHRDIAIKDLLKDISKDIGLTIHKRTNEEGSLVAYISKYELDEGTSISQILKQLEIKDDGSITAEDYSNGLDSESGGAKRLPKEEIKIVDIIQFTPSHTSSMKDTAANLYATDLAAYSLASFAANAVTEAMNKEQLIWEGRGLVWQDLVAYINNGQSSRVLIKQEVEGDKELADKLKDILAGEEVLSAAGFKKLIHNTKSFGYDIKTDDGLMLETMLAIERVLAVHAENVKVLGGDSYLYNIAPSKGQTYEPADLIKWANNVYKQGEVQLQPVEHQLPEVVNITDRGIKQAKRHQEVQEIIGMLDETEHIVYGAGFKDWLNKLDYNLVKLVKERLTILAEKNVDNIMDMNIEGEKIIRDLDRHPNKERWVESGLMEIWFPDIRVKKGDTKKLRIYFLPRGEFEGNRQKIKEIVLLGGSKLESGSNNKDLIKKHEQNTTIRYIDEKLKDPDSDWLSKQIEESVQKKVAHSLSRLDKTFTEDQIKAILAFKFGI